ncbi:PP2C family protein-serine/threonine phosphatase [Streptomyces sp. NPDC050504]|uniref:PP2C family protein-serine/threonine phosphatase n=1 Tax=Streptomyces sp. NPDC050504 TaxID=3365618 RepID=UPI003793D84B
MILAGGTGDTRARQLLPLALPAVWGALAVVWKLACPIAQDDSMAPRVTSSIVFFSVGAGLVLGARRHLALQLRQIREVAHAAQQVLLRPLPPRIDGLAIAASQLSAARGATVGGDLYEAVATPYGVRVVMGDVRGHGLSALGAVAAVLGSFREAAHDEAELAGVLRRLERALQRHLRERSRAEHPASGGAEPDCPMAEEFVTLLLLEIGPEGQLSAVNCGHPWPYRLDRRAEPLSTGDPLPPLGPFPLPADIPVHTCARLLPSEALFLHTDGAEDARDGGGAFFPLEELLAEIADSSPVSPAAVIRRVHGALLRHTGGRPTDDIALLVLRNDRARVPAQPGEAVLRRRTRTRSAASNR